MVGRKVLFYLLLGAATVGLSRFLDAWRGWRQVPSAGGGVEVVVWGLGVLGAMLWLGFLLYEVDRAAGRVRHRVALYEWVLARRAEGRRPDLFGEGRVGESRPSAGSGGR
jgi:hypothetical protein